LLFSNRLLPILLLSSVAILFHLPRIDTRDRHLWYCDRKRLRQLFVLHHFQSNVSSSVLLVNPLQLRWPRAFPSNLESFYQTGSYVDLLAPYQQVTSYPYMLQCHCPQRFQFFQSLLLLLLHFLLYHHLLFPYLRLSCLPRQTLRLLARFFLDCLLVYFSLLQRDLLMHQVSTLSRKIHFHQTTTAIIRR